MYGKNINIRFGGPLTPAVKKIMIINGGIFLVQQFVGLFSPGVMEYTFGISHVGFLIEFKLWQIFTYMFMHGGWLHIIFNLIGLWMFGGDLEEIWGSKLFIKYYLYSGLGAGFFIAVMNFIIYSKYQISPVTLGASGAIYAVLLAYGLTWPNREVLLYFIIPVKIKYLVIGFGLIEFFGTLSSAAGSGGNISHIGHLGGLVSGFIIIYYRTKYKMPLNKNKSEKKENVINSALRSARLKKKKQEISTRIKAKKIIDELLEKIARSGMSSLSPDEKKNLEWARKHYYPEGNDTLH